jgi:para-aminobenzoate synthetase/4-amino-4-deoxychorismate lyase
MAFDPLTGIPLLERHLARMKASARLFGFAFDRHMIRNELQAATFRLSESSRIRLLLARSGAIAIGIAPMPEAPGGPVEVALAPLPVAPDDFRLRHKTSRRDFYTREPGAFETVYVDAQGYLTEGSFSSVFVERGGRLVTPPLARGLLPGVLRAELIDSGRAVEGDLTPGDLADGFFIGNALRGLVSAVTFAQRSKA